MPKIPPIPEEQRSFHGEKARDRLRSAEPDRRDEAAGLQADHGEPNVEQEGQQAAIRQNTHYQQDR